jgi:hypothetical protein
MVYFAAETGVGFMFRYDIASSCAIVMKYSSTAQFGNQWSVAELERDVCCYVHCARMYHCIIQRFSPFVWWHVSSAKLFNAL